MARKLKSSSLTVKNVIVVVGGVALAAVAMLYMTGYFTFTPVPMKIEKFNYSQYKVDRKDEEYLVDQSDVKHYEDIEKAYNTRLKFYEPVVERPVERVVDRQRQPEQRQEPELTEYYVNHYVFRDYLHRNAAVDNQNVHDIVIQNNVKNKYKTIGGPGTSVDDTKRSILAFCKNDREIFDILEKIHKRNATILNFKGDTEMEVIGKTWNDANEAVKAQIIHEIRDCKTGTLDDIYCPSGVATRIVSATYIENPDHYPKDKDSINREILAKCAYLRNQDPEIAPEKLQEAIIDDYRDIHDRQFITHLMEPWIEYI